MKNPNILTRSSYTFFNSLLKIQDIIDLAVSNNFTNAFLIDKNIMYGAMEFYIKCKKNNIKPIIGLEIGEENNKKILIAKNFKGYKNLMEISSKINLNSPYKIDEKNLINFNNKVNVVAYKNVNDIEVLEYFSSVSNANILAQTTHFLGREEFELVYGIETLNKIDSIIDEVNLEIEFNKKSIIPNFKENGKKVDANEFLEKKLKSSLAKYLNQNKNLNKQKYIERTSFELSTIKKMNFSSYFLIVADIVNWAKSQNIFIGPGRGSAPGSIVSFLLDITIVDPIKHELLFERFLNLERATMPDIDIDFEDARRDEVIKYICDKYGHEHVAQIITFQTLRARMSFKDIARIKNLSADETNKITKLIPEELTLEEAYNKEKKFREKIDSSDLLNEVYESAKLIEGLPRQFSTHAAGIVISDNPIFEFVPVQPGYGDTLQTQYSMDYMEMNGLLKIDILGLRNLSFLKEILHKIKKDLNVDININEINFNDPKVYKLLSEGKTSGIFQLESPGMKSSLKKVRVSNFEDIVAVTSLFRPGPIKHIPEFAQNKNNPSSQNSFISKEIEEILKPTYGIIVYQEQIMKIVQVFSNFSLSKADILRKAIGKKDIKLLESLKEEFVNGAKKNNFTDKQINDMYDHIYSFSNYGFNRSHAFAYSVISYWLSWLKINYPLQFITSLLNSSIGNASKISLYISEANEMNVKVLPPSILYSKGEYICKDKDIYIGFRSIKKVGDSIVKKLEVAQKNIKKNSSLTDVFIELDKAKITQTNIEILIKSWTFSEFANIETLLNGLSDFYEYINIIRSEKDDIYTYDKTLVPEFEWKKEESNKQDKDYFLESFGFNLIDNTEFKDIKELEKKKNIKSPDFTILEDGQTVEFIAKIISIREITTKTKRQMAFVNSTNGINKINLTFWPEPYSRFSSKLSISKKFIFYGIVDLKRSETVIIKKMEEI